MRFMMMVKCTHESEGGAPPNPALLEAIEKHRQEMAKIGVVVLVTGALAPSRQGKRVKTAGGKVTVIDGPFAETTELIGGFAILQVKSAEEATEVGKRFMQLHIDVLGPTTENTLEIRQLFTHEDFDLP